MLQTVQNFTVRCQGKLAQPVAEPATPSPRAGPGKLAQPVAEPTAPGIDTGTKMGIGWAEVIHIRLRLP